MSTPKKKRIIHNFLSLSFSYALQIKNKKIKKRIKLFSAVLFKNPCSNVTQSVINLIFSHIECNEFSYYNLKNLPTNVIEITSCTIKENFIAGHVEAIK
jgi:hypothetical protein